jgi:hypothetical protein
MEFILKNFLQNMTLSRSLKESNRLIINTEIESETN